jgi:hypothetical protein
MIMESNVQRMSNCSGSTVLIVSGNKEKENYMQITRPDHCLLGLVSYMYSHEMTML